MTPDDPRYGDPRFDNSGRYMPPFTPPCEYCGNAILEGAVEGKPLHNPFSRRTYMTFFHPECLDEPQEEESTEDAQ